MTADSPHAGNRSTTGAAASPPRRLLSTAALAVLIVVLLRAVLVQSFVIPSESMEEGLLVGDRVLVSRLDYRFGSIERGDVIVFDGTGVFESESAQPTSALGTLWQRIATAVGLPDGRVYYVKRVIGLPGERVVCCDSAGRITVDGKPLNEPYLYPGNRPSEQPFDVVVPEGRLWLMGDHRAASADSRAHLGDPGGGMVPQERVIGRVVAVWWPLGHLRGVGRVDPTVQGLSRVGAAREAAQ